MPLTVEICRDEVIVQSSNMYRESFRPAEARALATALQRGAYAAERCWAACPIELDWSGSGGHGKRAPGCDLERDHAGDHGGDYCARGVTARVNWPRKDEPGARPVEGKS